MDGSRLVSVRLVSGVTLATRCPSWCRSGHPDGLHIVDFSHHGPEEALIVGTHRGPVDVLTVALAQYPFGTDPERRAPVATVLLDGAWYEMDPDGLVGLADGLVVHARRIRALADRLAVLRSEDGDGP